MHNPPHPGEVIDGIYLEPFDVSIRTMAAQLGVSPSTFGRVVSGKNAVSPDMAIRLSKVLGRSPESWLQMQANYDLWVAQQQNPHDELVAYEFAN
ncbi:HigA family addiction module antitoxin [Altericista sp. CCNU0014]|uniref:HigA family addiction module antitoxin n=1 Tax=Altericista sp. CCNU0014 TaxID=3082949 RepID=UPI00384B4E79